MPRHILKSTGEEQIFSPEKVITSVERAGGSADVAEQTAKFVSKEKPATTADVHKLAFHFLKKRNRPLAARYDLKRALMKLGPSGFPFERYVAALLHEKGYAVAVGQVLKGKCVTHEVDVVAEKGSERNLIECKFHQYAGSRSDVKVALYIKARFDDLDAHWKATGDSSSRAQKMWIVTNTEFTSDATQYARCNGMIHLMSWNYPYNEGLGRLIDETGLHPITALTTLSEKQKSWLLGQGHVLCRDIEGSYRILRGAGITGPAADRIMREANELCRI